MNGYELTELRKYRWMESRIPALDALSTFVPDAQPLDPVITQMQERLPSRWYPEHGGHKVLLRFDGGPYDTARFTLEPAAWNHEHCDCCTVNIPAMTLCHVTEPGEPYVLLCDTCFTRNVARRR